MNHDGNVDRVGRGVPPVTVCRRPESVEGSSRFALT
jgi:hypothetical protein